MITTVSAAGQAAVEHIRAVDMGRFFEAAASTQALGDLGGGVLIKHTAEVLGDAGHSDEWVAEFKDAKVG